MIIYSKTGSIILDIEVDDASYRYRAIRQGDKVYLYFSLTQHVEIPIYSYINFQGQRYTLWKPENLTKHGERNLDYTVEFGGWWELLNRTKYKFLSGKPHKLKFPLTAKPRMFMQLVIDNLNLHDSGWTLGTCIDAPEKAMTFSHETCMEVLNRLADEYNTEFEFVNKTINFGKVERFKDDPLPLSYGKGNGFKTGVGRQTQGEKAPVTILYVQGGDRNIDSSKYGSPTLLLPKNQELEYQGRRYKTDPDGMYITRADRELINYNEDGYDASDIYPSRIGTISEVVTVDASKNFYGIIDSSIPNTLDYSKCKIAGEKATIIFQSGIMVGREFDIEQTDDALTGYIHSERRFKIVLQEIDGTIMPNDTFKPKVGDKYAIFNISLPDAYICDNASKSGASWDMFREAVRYMYENEDENFTFSGELDGIWAKKRWLEIGGKLQPGGYVRFSDNQFQPEGLLIRITAVKDYINKPHSPELELSNTPVAGFVSSELGKIEENEVKDEERHKSALLFTKRRWRDAKETLEMLSNALLNFSGSINPITVHTMMLLLGDESLQYRFVDNKTNPSQTGHIITYDKTNKILNIPAGIIQHMTLGIKEISSAHKVSDYKFWTLPALNYAVDGTDAYYLYAKVSNTSETGMFVMSKTAIGMQDVAGYYHLLVGVLNSEFDTERSFVELYGFTEILPGRITTDRIISSDGLNFLDFVNNAVRIGNARTFIDYNSRGDEKIRVKGTIVQSESGEESFIGCFRGTYNSTYTYYEGDEVTYTYNGGTSTYRYIYSSSGKGYAPTNTSRWKLIASQGTNGTNGTNGNDGNDGIDGIDGAYFEYRYAVNGSRTSPPSLSKTSTYPSGWVTEMPSVGSLQYLWCTVAKKSAAGFLLSYWSTPTRITGYDGKDGEVGPALTFQGAYSSGRTYYGTGKRVDAVKYNGIYYVARVDAGNGFSNKPPTDRNYWNEFGNQFENVATNLLLAENAAIGSWWHSGGKIVSTLSDGNKIILDAAMAKIIIESARSAGTSSLNTSMGAKITLDAANGSIEARAKSDTSKVACMSPSGIFCNSANTQAVSSIYGSDVRAAIVGLGYGSVSRDDVYRLGNFLAGVYGVASNSGNAPAYGGYFRDLMAAGLILNRKVVESGGVYLNGYDTFVVGYSQNECSVYLPNDGVIGRIILLKQRNTGALKCYARGGQKIYDDYSVNSYFKVYCGHLVIAIFDRCYINGVLTEAWLINTISDLIHD